MPAVIREQTDGLLSGCLYDLLEELPRPGCYWVAYSGGRDSHVLLHAMASLSDQLTTPLRAIHINHGLQSAADDWEAHCIATCKDLDIPLETVRLALSPIKGESLEALAREGRYRAISALIKEGELLLTAHHQDDQAETLLLQLLRGAGPAGLGRCRGLTRLVTAIEPDRCWDFSGVSWKLMLPSNN